jgi:hypothetical protein
MFNRLIYVLKRKKNKQRRKEKGRKANMEDKIDERKINMT